MRYSTTSALVLGALTIGEVVASPTHVHRHRHAKKDIDWNTLDWNNMGVDWVSAYKAGQHSTPAAEVAPTPTGAAFVEVAATTTPAPAPAATTPSSPAADAGSNAANSGSSSSDASLWHGLVGKANHLTAFGHSTPTSGSIVGYIGNVGSPIEGSNMIKVASTSGYDFTNTFINTSKQSMTVVIWNKAASQGMANPLAADPNLGSCIAPEVAALTIALVPGASQTVAFMDKSVIGWAQATEKRAYSGQFATTWGEAKFDATGSGYDVSAIMNPNNNNYDMTITSQEAPACTSSRTQNFWLTDTQPIGNSDGSCYIAQSTAHLKTLMGGTI